MHFLDDDEYEDQEIKREFGVTPTSDSERRFYRRRLTWMAESKDQQKGELEHLAHWLLHNCVVHPLLGLFPSKATVRFHSWSSMKLNKTLPFEEPMPEIKDRLAWIRHNVVAHMKIGLWANPESFMFHDRTAEEMNVPDWV